MRLHELPWLLALAEHEHMTDAAASVGVPQPTLSRALGRAEAETGVRIFERRHDGLSITPLGKIVVEAAADIVERHRRLRTDLANELDPDTGVVRLAFLDSTGASLVPHMLREFREIAPDVRIVLAQEPGHRISEDLAARRVDLALTAGRPDGDYGWIPMREERIVLIVPRSHALAAERSIEVGRLLSEPFIALPQGFGYRAQTDALLAGGGVLPRIAFESEDPSTIEGLVSVGLGVALLPESYAGVSGTVGVELETPRAYRRIGLTWREDGPLPQPAARLRDLVAARFALPTRG